jgi:precorrin-6B methylase 1
MHQESDCRCGCVPKISSLFEMAEKRKKFLEDKKVASLQQGDKDIDSIVEGSRGLELLRDDEKNMPSKSINSNTNSASTRNNTK